MRTNTIIAIDASSLINLIATGWIEEILRATGMQLITTDNIASEVRFLSGPPDDEGNRPQVPINLAYHIQKGHLTCIAIPESGLDLFVDAATQLPDNDASIVALAGSVGAQLATDDGKIRRVARELVPAISLLTSLSIIRSGGDSLQLRPDELMVIASNLRWSANFLAPRGDQDAAWYRGWLEKSTLLPHTLS